MSCVRKLVPADLPRLAELHESIFSARSHLGREQRRWHLRRVFLENPWADESLPSLVAEGEHGRIVGFLGVLPRRMSWNGRPINVAVASQFMVEPQHRGVAGLCLVKTFLAGPQDLSMTDGATHESAKIWKAVGGTDSPLHSIHWTRPLRPMRYALSLARDRIPLAVAATPVCSVVDAIATRTRRSPFRLGPAAVGEQLTLEAMLDSFDPLTPRVALRPEYDRRSLEWLLEMAAHKVSCGDLRRVLVRGPDHEVIGWYLYYLGRRRSAEVLQIAGRQESFGEVVEHLFSDAWREGAIAVSGRLQPKFFDALSARHCLFHDRGSPVLIHSRRRELVDAIRAGEAFLTRLDGEWWMCFQHGSTA